MFASAAHRTATVESCNKDYDTDSTKVGSDTESDAESDYIIVESDTESGYTMVETDNESDTTSLASNWIKYWSENDRLYIGDYFLPVDKKEQDRQNALHSIWKGVLQGKLLLAPVGQNTQRVLDLGTGTGSWAIEFADRVPNAQITGTDLCDKQPEYLPPKLEIFIDDMRLGWMECWKGRYDFIHARDLSGSISDLGRLYSQAYECLKAGGWLEVQEMEIWVKSDDDSLKNAPRLIKLQEQIDKASKRIGNQMNVAEQQKGRIVDAGFEHVVHEVYKMPISSGLEVEELPGLDIKLFMATRESYSLALLTRVLELDIKEVQDWLAAVERELSNEDVRAYSNLHVIYGQRPNRQRPESGPR